MKKLKARLNFASCSYGQVSKHILARSYGISRIRYGLGVVWPLLRRSCRTELESRMRILKKELVNVSRNSSNLFVDILYPSISLSATAEMGYHKLRLVLKESYAEISHVTEWQGEEFALPSRDWRVWQCDGFVHYGGCSFHLG